MRPVKNGFRKWTWLPVLLVWLLIWQLVCWLIDSELLLASPWQVGKSLLSLFLQPGFWQTTLFSILRIEAGFGLGVLIGTLLAVLTVRFRWMYAFFYPAISAIKATPVASFIILALVWMSSSRVVIFIVFLMVLPIIWANVTEGIRRTDPQLLEMAKVFRLSRSQVVRLIYLPTVSPFFVAAISTSLGLGWKAGIAAEVLSLPRHALGSELYKAKIYLETADLLAFTLVIIILSLFLEKVLLALLRRTESYFQRHGRMGALSGISRQDLRQRRIDSREDRP